MQHLLTGTPGWVHNALNAGDHSEKAETVLMTLLSQLSPCAAELHGKMCGELKGLDVWLFPFCQGCLQAAYEQCFCKEPYIVASESHICPLKRWKYLSMIKKTSWHTSWTNKGRAELSVRVFPAGPKSALVGNVHWNLLGSGAALVQNQCCVSASEILIKGDMKLSLFSGLLKMLWEYQPTLMGWKKYREMWKRDITAVPRKSKSYTAISPKRFRWIKG